ncbi:hypothetical protein HN031_07460 [Nocardioides sp. zg-1308]|uniref:YciI family protein n=1 Tax=Nocardioides sp. zg-1308 TaxID=2736253 RepID=UPI001552BB68|nr:YciI family protein [Nocardioides sp. zg-1308]NPD04520.1 hypothetical protein [Nocardioides sp. zg-1308]
MHYLLSVVDDTATPGPADEPGAVDRFNDQLKQDGYWVFAGGLQTLDTATVVDARSGDTTVTDGPFAETKEYLAGFWVIEASDLDVALTLAEGGSRACRRKIEVRPFDGIA